LTHTLNPERETRAWGVWLLFFSRFFQKKFLPVPSLEVLAEKSEFSSPIVARRAAPDAPLLTRRS
jgi:hypothetical protein